ncbi:hypothetical protein HK104_003378 [Borealophlyctis nickersoniae]|nr:hypothetical protein HK104_003378 [Borealophlyctis nickersoniae]
MIRNIEQEETDKKKRMLEDETEKKLGEKKLGETGKETTGRGRELLKLIASTFGVCVTADLDTSPMRDVVYDFETRALHNKFEFLLDHFDELTRRSTIGFPEWCEPALDDHVDRIAGMIENFLGGGRRLTDEERAWLKTFSERQLRRAKELFEEMDKMRALEWKAWNQYLEDEVYEYESYALDARIAIWEEFDREEVWENELSKEMDMMRPPEWKAWYQYLENGNHKSYDSYGLDYRITIWDEFVRKELHWYNDDLYWRDEQWYWQRYVEDADDEKDEDDEVEEE